MKASAKRTEYFRYPVELVWKSIGAGSKRDVDALTEEQFAETEPAANEVYTKSLEIKTNEVFAFRMKTRGFLADFRIELTPVGPCKTKVTLREDMEYRTSSAFLAGGFGLSVRKELKGFALMMQKRLKDMKC